jgi:hypothetical protein
MKLSKSLAIIEAIALSAAVASSSVISMVSAISQQGLSHALRPGHGVCNADANIHEHSGLSGKTDVNFHRAGEKNFGGVSNFVGPSSICKNPG